MEKLKLTLKNLRKKGKYTQAAVAEKLGISARAYAKIEAGETNLTIGRLRLLACIFNVSLTQLLEEVPDEHYVTDLSSTTISLLRHYEETIQLLKAQNATLTDLLYRKNNIQQNT